MGINSLVIHSFLFLDICILSNYLKIPNYSSCKIVELYLKIYDQIHKYTISIFNKISNKLSWLNNDWYRKVLSKWNTYDTSYPFPFFFFPFFGVSATSWTHISRLKSSPVIFLFFRYFIIVFPVFWKKDNGWLKRSKGRFWP